MRLYAASDDSVDAGDFHCAIIFNINFGTSLFTNLTNHLTTRANDIADFINWILIVVIFGAESANASLADDRLLIHLTQICKRPSLACASACCIISGVMDVILISI